jgi:hypothetical protein
MRWELGLAVHHIRQVRAPSKTAGLRTSDQVVRLLCALRAVMAAILILLVERGPQETEAVQAAVAQILGAGVLLGTQGMAGLAVTVVLMVLLERGAAAAAAALTATSVLAAAV